MGTGSGNSRGRGPDSIGPLPRRCACSAGDGSGASPAPVPLPHARRGVEGTGVVDALGPGITKLEIGDPVILTAEHGPCSRLPKAPVRQMTAARTYRTRRPALAPLPRGQQRERRRAPGSEAAARAAPAGRLETYRSSQTKAGGRRPGPGSPGTRQAVASVIRQQIHDTCPPADV